MEKEKMEKIEKEITEKKELEAETPKKKGLIKRLFEAIADILESIKGTIMMITMPKKSKELLYEKAITSNLVHEKNKETKLDEVDTKEKTVAIEKDKNKEVTQNTKEKEEKKESEKEKTAEEIEKEEKERKAKELQFEELCKKASMKPVGFELDNYIEIVLLAKELDKEPKYINITGPDDKKYYISAYRDKDGIYTPIFKDCTEKGEKISINKAEMKEVLEHAKQVNNHLKPTILQSCVIQYDFNKAELRERLSNALKDGVFKDPAVADFAQKILEQNNAYHMSHFYNVVSSQPDTAAYFHKLDDMELRMPNLDPQIPAIVLRMNYIEQMASFCPMANLHQEAIILSKELEDNRTILEQALQVDVDKYQKLIDDIQKSNPEIVFDNPTKETELSQKQNQSLDTQNYAEPTLPDLSSQVTDLTNCLAQDEMYVPEALIATIQNALSQNDDLLAKQFIQTFSKCPTENVDCKYHSCDTIRENCQLSESDAVFYTHYLFIKGLETLSLETNLPEVKAYENEQKQAFINQLLGEYSFIYQENRSQQLQSLGLYNEINRIAESIGLQIIEEPTQHELFTPEQQADMIAAVQEHERKEQERNEYAEYCR